MIDITFIVKVAAWDASTITQLVSFSFSSNTPLTRAPFSNMFADFIVSGPLFRGQGLGGLKAAGFWDSNWRPAQESVVIVDAESPTEMNGQEEPKIETNKEL